MNNRQFKFRYWDTAIGDWQHKFCYFELEPKKSNVIGCTILPIDRPDRYIIQQSTGLTDKNGKEIYEGDIVKQTMEKGPHLPSIFKDHILKDCEKQHVAEITWGYYCDGEYVDKIECFMFGNRNSLSELIHRTTGNYHEWLFTYEVIGNIFETPELLKNFI